MNDKFNKALHRELGKHAEKQSEYAPVASVIEPVP